MSKSTQRANSDKEQAVREQLRRDFNAEYWTEDADVHPVRRTADVHPSQTRQAIYHDRTDDTQFEDLRHHHDAEEIYWAFPDENDNTLPPFHRILARDARQGGQATSWPSAYLNHLIHLDDAEMYALERGDLSIFEHAPRSRKRVVELLAKPEYSDILMAMEDGGTGFHCHAKPGKGKTSFNIHNVIRSVEVNNETYLWMLTLDECEPLPLAPWMTLAVPEGVTLDATAVPVRQDLPRTTIDPELVFRDTIRYSDPIDLLEQVVPGGIYGVLPDPRFRKCERLVRANYNTAWEADDAGDVTPLRDYSHAVLEARAKRDIYLHPTTMFIDEFGDLCPRNPEANEHDEYRKTKEFPNRLAKGRKKNLSVSVASHSLREVDEDILFKERCWVTFPNTPVPNCSGIESCPLPKDKPLHIDPGSAFSWDTSNYVELDWPDPYKVQGFRGELKLSYPRMEAKIDAM